MIDVKESDWKLFRKRVPGWQEAWMDELNREYIALLESDGQPSDKFWELEKSIRRDRQSVGVVIDMRRSMMTVGIMRLLGDGVISLDDLDGFSEELVEKMRYLMREYE